MLHLKIVLVQRFNIEWKIWEEKDVTLWSSLNYLFSRLSTNDDHALKFKLQEHAPHQISQCFCFSGSPRNMFEHYGNRGTCPFCRKVFHQNLNRHVKTVCLNLKPYRCSYCKASYKDNRDRLKHELLKHPTWLDKRRQWSWYRFDKGYRTSTQFVLDFLAFPLQLKKSGCSIFHDIKLKLWLAVVLLIPPKRHQIV